MDAVRLIKRRYFAQAAAGVIVFLRIVVAADPPRSVVSREGKLRFLFLQIEVGQSVLLREFIAEAETVVIYAETDVHRHAVCAEKMDKEFIAMVPDTVFFSEDRSPGFVDDGTLRSDQGEAILQSAAVHKSKAQF